MCIRDSHINVANPARDKANRNIVPALSRSVHIDTALTNKISSAVPMAKKLPCFRMNRLRRRRRRFLRVARRLSNVEEDIEALQSNMYDDLLTITGLFLIEVYTAQRYLLE